MAETLKLVRDGTFCTSDIMGPKVARVTAVLSGFVPDASSIGDIFTCNLQAKEKAIQLSGVAEGMALPGTTSSVCACLEIRAQSTGGPNFIITWDFERPYFSSPTGQINSLYKVYERKTFVDVQRVRLPHVDSGKILTIGWKDDTDANNIIQPQTATLTVRKPAMMAVLAGTFNQKPTYVDGSTVKYIGDAMGTVNKSDFSGFARGYWLFAGMEVSRPPAQLNREVQCTIISLVDEDWSEYILLEHPSGIIPKFSESQMNAAKGTGANDIYPRANEGYIRPSTQALRDTNGIARVAPYAESDWAKVFASVVND